MFCPTRYTTPTRTTVHAIAVPPEHRPHRFLGSLNIRRHLRVRVNAHSSTSITALGTGIQGFSLILGMF